VTLLYTRNIRAAAASGLQKIARKLVRDFAISS
jgi:hypothetical protein